MDVNLAAAVIRATVIAVACLEGIKGLVIMGRAVTENLAAFRLIFTPEAKAVKVSGIVTTVTSTVAPRGEGGLLVSTGGEN